MRRRARSCHERFLRDASRPRASSQPCAPQYLLRMGLRFPDPPLSDGLVALRPWGHDDLWFVVHACRDPELSRYSPSIPFPYREADARGWFETQEPARISGHSIDFAVVDAAAGALLGAIGLHRIDQARKAAEVGYWLAQDARGHGQITRALRLLAKWGFEGLGLKRLELTTDPENARSQRVAERCGFQKEGRLRSHLVIRHSGERRDSLIYGLLPGELARPSGDQGETAAGREP